MDMFDAEFIELNTMQLRRNTGFRLISRNMVYTEDFIRRTDSKLIIDDYFCEIPLELYEMSGTHILHVDFIKVTCLHNLFVLLKHCPNIQTLKFTTVSLDEYKKYSPQPNNKEKGKDASPIHLQHLWSLEFENFGLLTKDELIILDFLTTTINTSSLRHLNFSTKNPFEFRFMTQQLIATPTLSAAQPYPEHNEVMMRYGQQLELTTLAKFMIKNHTSLNTLVINRSCFNFFVGATRSTEEELQLSKEFAKVQLGQISFLTDTFGIENLLIHQRRTVSLICRGNSVNNYVNPAILNSFAIAIRNCSATLQEIQAQGLLLFQGNYEETFSKQDQLQETLKHDLSKYQNCNKLKTLNINFGKILVTSKDKFRETIPGSFINAHLLPSSLVKVELTVGINNLEEFHSFTSRLSQLVNLEQLKFTSLIPYEIDEHCFRNILSTQSRRLIYAHFINAMLVENVSPQKIILQLEQEQTEHRHQQQQLTDPLNLNPHGHLQFPFLLPPPLLALDILDNHWEIKISKNGVFFGKVHALPLEHFPFQASLPIFPRRFLHPNPGPVLDFSL